MVVQARTAPLFSALACSRGPSCKTSSAVKCYVQPPRPPSRKGHSNPPFDSSSSSTNSGGSSSDIVHNSNSSDGVNRRSSSRTAYSDQGSGMASFLSPKEIMQLIKAADSSQEVLQIVCRLHSSFDAINTVTALHKMAKLMCPSSRQAVMQHPGMTVLLGLAEAKAHSFNKQAIGNILWALAKMQQSPSARLLSLLTAAVNRNLPAFTSQHLANSIWGLVRLGHTPDSELLAAIAKQATIVLKDAHAVCFISDLLLFIACCQDTPKLDG